MPTKILITDGMAQGGVDILKAESDFDIDLRKETSAEELGNIIADYDCIVVRSATTITKELIEKASNMKLYVRAGAGVDNIDVSTATEKKVPVMNTASANSLAAAEQTIALMFSMLRMIPQAYQSLQQDRWDRDLYKGHEAGEKTLGVVGLGNIGRIVARLGIGVGMNVVAYDPTIKSHPDKRVRVVSSLDDLLAQIDILTIHVPKIKATSGLIGAAEISKLKKGSWILNCARGGIVDEKAVYDALESGHLTGAGFDVFDKEPPDFSNPLLKHPKAVCVPHLGASTFEAQKRVALTAANQIVGFFKKNDRTGVIN